MGEKNYAGGVVGYTKNDSTVTNCYNTDTVTANGGDVSFAGGLVGYIADNCTVTNCYNTGAVTASSDAGGLLGRSNGGTMTNCYWLNTAASVASGSGGNGNNVTNYEKFTEAQGKGTESDFSYTIGANTKTGTLCAALNDWVQAQATPNNYLNWTNLSNVAYPILKTSHTLSFDAKGGTVFPESQPVVSGDPYGDLPTPTREGYTFNGWFTADEGGDKVTSATVVTVTENHTLYAQWTLNSYTVTFDVKGGSAVPEAIISHGQTITKPDDPTRDGYSFSAWYKDAAFAEVWDFAKDTVTSDMTLYAQWTEIPRSSGGGGGGSGSSSTGSSITAATPLPTPEQPNPPAVGSVTPAATVDASGIASVRVTEQDVKSAIDAALAASAGSDGNGLAVSIDLSGLQTQFNSLPLTLSRGVYQALTAAGVRYLEIKTPQISLSLDLQTLQTILRNMGEEITISAERIDPAGLAGAAKLALGSRPFYRLSISDGARAITEFGGGRIALSLPYAPAEGEHPGGLFAVYVDGAGAVAWLWNSSYSQTAQTLFFDTGHFSSFGIGYREAPNFSDTAAHWASEDIAYVALRGLMTGTAEAIFSPDLGMTRGMLVTVLWRMEGSPEAAGAAAFSDVSPGAWYAEAVAWAAEHGIVSGYGGAGFGPNDSITREQMAAILHRYAQQKGYDVSLGEESNILSYEDAFDISEYAIAALQWACGAGLMQGSEGKLTPQGDATRAQVAAVLHSFDGWK